MVVLWKNVCLRRYVILFAELLLESAHVLPQQVFSAKLDRPREVVDFLVLVQFPYVFALSVPCPHHIEPVGSHQLEASVLQRVHHCVIDVCALANSE